MSFFGTAPPFYCGTFYFSDVEPRDWTTPSNNSLWQEAVKTLFDPCPAGWRVTPKTGNPWQAFSSSSNAIISGAWDIPNKGVLWTAPAVSGGKAWYGTSGFRNNSKGNFSDYGSRSLVWSTGPGSTTSYFNVAQDDVFLNTAVHAHSFSVRCIRE